VFVSSVLDVIVSSSSLAKESQGNDHSRNSKKEDDSVGDIDNISVSTPDAVVERVVVSKTIVVIVS